MQALKIIRRMIEVDAAALPRTLVVTLVAVAQQPDDDFRRVCIDTLRQLGGCCVVCGVW